MPQPHWENHGAGLFGVVKLLDIQSTASAAANTWTKEETACHVKMNQFKEKLICTIQLNCIIYQLERIP